MEQIKILFVDDDANVIKSLVRLFSSNKYQLYTVNTGARGLELVEQNEFPVVVADFRMPFMSGIQFLKKVKEKAPDTVRMLLTGYADVNIVISAVNEGHIYKFITKPWEPEELKLQIQLAIEHYYLLKEKQKLTETVLTQNQELERINRNLEQLVAERTQQLLQSEKLAVLGQMAGQIGHEIRNSLTILKGNIQLLEMQYVKNTPLQSKVQILYNALERLIILSRNLLTLGKPTQVEFKILNVPSVVEHTVHTLVETGILKYYSIKKDYPDDGVYIYGDQNQIEQALINIFVNAHHAMKDTGILAIAVKKLPDTGFCEVFVGDSRCGISPENIDKIFDPFFTTKPEGEGTGLGLPVVKNIVGLHNGYIRVESTVQHGTTMILGFPIFVSNGGTPL